MSNLQEVMKRRQEGLLMKKGPGFGTEEALTAILVYLMKQKKRSRK